MRNIFKRTIIILIAIKMCIVNIPMSFAQEPKGHVTISVEKFTLGQGYIKEPIKVPFYEGDSVAHIVTRLLGDGNYTNTGSVGDTSGTVETGFYLASVRDGFNGSEPTNIPKYILDEISKDDNVNIEYQRLEPGFLGEFDYTNQSGWMYSVNNWFPNYGSSVCWPKDGDVIRWQFTTYGYGKDIGGGLDDNFQGSYKKIANKDSLTKKIGEINSSSNKNEILSNSKIKDAYENSFKILEKVDSTQAEVDNALNILNSAINSKPEQPPVEPEQPPVEPEQPPVEILEEKIIGSTRYETAIKISKNGWDSAENVVIVNGDKLPDALAATPLAKEKNAPILLTNTNKLNKETREELKRLNPKNIMIIGGEVAVSQNVKSELEQMGMNVDRISGKTRFETSLEIAKRLSNIVSVSEIAVVNGEKGLSDATSIAAIAANKSMPIILMPTKGTSIYDKYIKDNNIQKTYIIGQTGSISTEIEGKLPNSERIGGRDRNDTNAKIVDRFYGNSLKSIFVCKNGSLKEDHLIDALSVGVLAAKENSPVVIVGNSLSESQKNVLGFKEVKKIVQVGGGSEKVFDEIKDLYAK